MSPDDLARILDELGQRLGPTGEHVFALAVRQVYIVSLMEVAGGLLLTTMSVAVVLLGRRQYQHDLAAFVAKHDAYESGPDWATYTLAFGGGALLALVVAVTLVAFGIPGLLNPEYAALRDILGAIGR